MWDHWLCGPQCCAKFVNIIDFLEGWLCLLFLVFFFLNHSLLKVSLLHSTAAEQLQNWNLQLQEGNLEKPKLHLAQLEHPQSREKNRLLILAASLGPIQKSPSSSSSPLPDFPDITDHAHPIFAGLGSWDINLLHFRFLFPSITTHNVLIFKYPHQKAGNYEKITFMWVFYLGLININCNSAKQCR